MTRGCGQVTLAHFLWAEHLQFSLILCDPLVHRGRTLCSRVTTGHLDKQQMKRQWDSETGTQDVTEKCQRLLRVWSGQGPYSNCTSDLFSNPGSQRAMQGDRHKRHREATADATGSWIQIPIFVTCPKYVSAGREEKVKCRGQNPQRHGIIHPSRQQTQFWPRAVTKEKNEQSSTWEKVRCWKLWQTYMRAQRKTTAGTNPSPERSGKALGNERNQMLKVMDGKSFVWVQGTCSGSMWPSSRWKCTEMPVWPWCCQEALSSLSRPVLSTAGTWDPSRTSCNLEGGKQNHTTRFSAEWQGKHWSRGQQGNMKAQWLFPPHQFLAAEGAGWLIRQDMIQRMHEVREWHTDRLT